VRGIPSILNRQVDGGFAVGAFSFNRHGSPRSFELCDGVTGDSERDMLPHVTLIGPVQVAAA
jgi:hypothetical protein